MNGLGLRVIYISMGIIGNLFMEQKVSFTRESSRVCFEEQFVNGFRNFSDSHNPGSRARSGYQSTKTGGYLFRGLGYRPYYNDIWKFDRDLGWAH